MNPWERAKLAIVGPTASGKSQLALTYAQRYGAVILSCDSLCIYKNLNIGTAKPTQEERQWVTHYGLDLKEPHEAFTATDFITEVERVLKLETRPVILVGGSGFYLKALVTPRWPQESQDLEYRNQLDANFNNDQLYLQLKIHDPTTKVHPHDRYRLLRALEFIHTTGSAPSQVENLSENALAPLLRKLPILALTRPFSDLEQRIRLRTQTMLKLGLIDEVKALAQRYDPENLPRCLESVGYSETLDFLKKAQQGPTTQSDILELEGLISLHTRQLAKRQMTFLRGLEKRGDLLWSWWTLPENQPQLDDHVHKLMGFSA